MKLTLTVRADHAILDDEEMVRRDIADKLNHVATVIRNNPPGRNWHRGSVHEDGTCVVKWQVDAMSRRQKNLIKDFVAKIDIAMTNRYGGDLPETALNSLTDDLAKLCVDFHDA